MGMLSESESLPRRHQDSGSHGIPDDIPSTTPGDGVNHDGSTHSVELEHHVHVRDYLVLDDVTKLPEDETDAWSLCQLAAEQETLAGNAEAPPSNFISHLSIAARSDHAASVARPLDAPHQASPVGVPPTATFLAVSSPADEAILH